MKHWPRRWLIVWIVALVFWCVSMPVAFLADGGWRIAGFAVWVASMTVFYVVLVREQRRARK